MMLVKLFFILCLCFFCPSVSVPQFFKACLGRANSSHGKVNNKTTAKPDNYLHPNVKNGTTAKPNDILQLNANNWTTQNSTIYIKKIEICKSFQSNICMHRPQNETSSINSEDNKYEIYTGVSCIFANYTVSKIYQFLEVGEQKVDWYEKLLNNSLNEEDKKLWIQLLHELKYHIGLYVRRFIDVLYEYLIKHSGALYYTDKTILKVFLTLSTKVDFIQSKWYSKPTPEVSNFDFVRSVLLELTALQSVASMNCSNIHFVPGCKSWYGCYMTNTVDLKVDDLLVAFENSTYSNTGYKSKCSVEHIFLENLVTLKSDGFHSFDIANARVLIPGKEPMSVTDILKKAKPSMDGGLIFWYQDSVLKTIVKKIFLKLMAIRSKKITLSKSTIDRIKTFIGIVPYTDNLPEYLIVGLNILTKFCDEPTGSEVTTSNLYTFFLTLDDIDLSRVRDAAFTNNIDECDYLNQFLSKLLEDNKKDFECFVKSFTILGNRNDKYYVPFTENKMARTNENNTKINDKGDRGVCEFVKHVYAICFGNINFLADKNNDKILESKDVLVNNGAIVKYFRDILKSDVQHIGLLKLAYNVFIMLNNQAPENSVHIFVIKRILNEIMNESNSYMIKHCDALEYKKLLFNPIPAYLHSFDSYNIPLSNFLDANFKIDKYSRTDVQTVDKSSGNKPVGGSSNVLNYLNTKMFFGLFIDNSDVFKTYGNKIQFYWKGKKQFVETIYRDAIVVTFNHYHLYALYDVYFKFYVAAVYYEMCVILRSTDDDLKMANLKLMKETMKSFTTYFHSPELLSLTSDIHEIISMDFDEMDKSIPLIELLQAKKDRLDKKFEKINIFFSSNDDGKFKSSDTEELKNRLVKLHDSYSSSKIVFQNIEKIMRR